MQLHSLSRTTLRPYARRIGRGGKRGKTSGRGTKGQQSRAGAKLHPEIREIIKKLPKLRGHGKNRARTVNENRIRAIDVNLAVLEARFDAGAEVSPKTLVASGVLRTKAGKLPVVKILANGSLTKALTVSGCTISASAKAKIEAAGGKVL